LNYFYSSLAVTTEDYDKYLKILYDNFGKTIFGFTKPDEKYERLFNRLLYINKARRFDLPPLVFDAMSIMKIKRDDLTSIYESFKSIKYDEPSSTNVSNKVSEIKKEYIKGN
jgi:hypothetical protein